MNSKVNYDLKSVKLPYLSGLPLRLFVWLLESPLGVLLLPKLFTDAGITAFREQQVDEHTTMHPLHFTGRLAGNATSLPPAELPGPTANPGPGFHYTTAHDYAQAYRDGRTNPEQVAQKVVAAISASNAAEPPLRAIIASQTEAILAQARASADRIRSGQPLSPLDGVPVAVKDELDIAAYPTTGGTAFLGKSAAAQDSTVVARLRAAGALLIGKANMHEIGIAVTGLNPHHGTTRNPYNPQHFTGGSSSGSAAAVAAGLCPIAIGADGGGSIRIPAALCGIVGLKATFGRVSEYGAVPLDWSVAHIGPLAATAADAALAYGIIAGADPKDPLSLHQPTPTLDGWQQLDLSGLRLGVYRPWFEHADAEMVSACSTLLDEFVGMGAAVHDIEIAGLEMGRIAHLITIAGEMAQAMDSYHDQHHKQHGLDVRTNLTLARAFTTRDYVKAQRVRTRLIENFNAVLQQVDVIITPTTAIPAPAIPPNALPLGNSDLTTLTEIMRFAPPANLTGLPAISFPAGYTPTGLPLGMQAIGRAWDEATLLRLALAAEGVVERQAPQWHYSLLA
ncbi:MAG: amidase [Anaerolineae bacterium]|nr:amidase [Anaerolineae bacterium]